MKSIGKRILIDPTPIEKVTKSGIILQPKSEDKPSNGKVILVGNEVKEITIGDIVHFNKHVGIEIVLNEVKYLSVKEDEVYIVE
jgi:co-chaperonin GroES (HSP10)